MQVKCVNSLLSKLVALTRERDENALESALVTTLTDVIATIHGAQAKPAVLFHIQDDKKRLLTATSTDKITPNPTLADEFKAAIFNCCNSGKLVSYTSPDSETIKLYPLKNANGRTASVISIEDPLIDHRLDTTIVTLLQIYQNFTDLINDNESDTLTGLLNRKTFDQRISRILTQMQGAAKRKDDKSNQVFFLAIFDIDHFKRVNDHFGHLIGDEVLLLFAQLMRQSVRETDPLFRFGGEEFVGMFECSSKADIHMVLERFRQKIQQFTFPQVGKITVSTGYTEIHELDAASQIIDRADSALYFAKNNGRNRTACYEQLIADGLLEEINNQGGIELF